MASINTNLLLTGIDEQIKKHWEELLSLVLDESSKSSLIIQILENKRLKNLKYVEEINILKLEKRLLEKRLRPRRTVGTQTGMFIYINRNKHSYKTVIVFHVALKVLRHISICPT